METGLVVHYRSNQMPVHGKAVGNSFNHIVVCAERLSGALYCHYFLRAFGRWHPAFGRDEKERQRQGHRVCQGTFAHILSATLEKAAKTAAKATA